MFWYKDWCDTRYNPALEYIELSLCGDKAM